MQCNNFILSTFMCNVINAGFILVNPRRMREGYGTCSVINPRRMREGYGTQFVIHYASVGGATRHTVVRLFVCQSVSHYAEGGANEVYCNRAVCQSVILSVASISRRSQKTKR